MAQLNNTQALGTILYTHYFYLFQSAGLVLLVAMIGAIVLTLRHKPNVKRQNISDQVARNRASAIEIVKVRPPSRTMFDPLAVIEVPEPDPARWTDQLRAYARHALTTGTPVAGRISSGLQV